MHTNSWAGRAQFEKYITEGLNGRAAAAHRASDETLERIYIGRRFKTIPPT